MGVAGASSQQQPPASCRTELTMAGVENEWVCLQCNATREGSAHSVFMACGSSDTSRLQNVEAPAFVMSGSGSAMVFESFVKEVTYAQACFGVLTLARMDNGEELQLAGFVCHPKITTSGSKVNTTPATPLKRARMLGDHGDALTKAEVVDAGDDDVGPSYVISKCQLSAEGLG